MKKTLYAVACLLVLQAGAQQKLAASDWQSDLKFLQHTVHNDYPFLFKKTSSEAFDKAVDELYNAIPTLAEHEIIAGLSRIVSSFQYGHTALGLRNDHVKFHRIPFNLYHFNDGVYLQAVHKDYEKALGARLIAIEDVPVAEALEAIRPVVPAENDQFFKAYGINYLGIPEVLHAQGVIKELKNTISFTLERNGKRFKQKFTAVEGLQPPGRYGFVKQEGEWLDVRTAGATPLYLKNLDKIYYFEYLPQQKAVYVRHSQIQDDPEEAIPAFYERVFNFVEQNDVERLIIDVRLNGGGNNYKNKPVITGIIRTEKINKQGKLFVIIGRRTFSACQNLVNEMDNYTNALFVGEPTAENINFYGDNRQVELPNSKIPVFLSFAWWQDKPQWENGPWTPPHIAVDMSFEDYRTNKDPALEAALNFSDTDLILNPMGHLTQLFLSGKLDEVKAEAKKMVTNPRYRFFDFETQINRAGYNLMGSNQTEGALFVFQLNAELFPGSANVWDSLAEAYMKSGNTAKAVEYYNKAIQLDPGGPTGKNGREMLKTLQKD